MSKSLNIGNSKKQTVGQSIKNFSFIQRFLIDNFNKVILDEIKQLKPNSVFDAGCGEGYTLQMLKTAGIGKKHEGIDSLEDAVNLGKKKYPGLNIYEGNIYKIHKKSNTFDVVMCNEVLEHLQDPEKALQELIRISNKYVVLTVPQEPLFMLSNLLRGKNVKRLGSDVEHINHWTNRQFVRFIGRYLKISHNITPMPWTMLIAEK